MEKTSIALYGFAERNAALLMTVRAEEGIDLVKEYLEKTDYRDEIQVKWIKRRIPDLKNFLAVFGELLSKTEKQKFSEILVSVSAERYTEVKKIDLDEIFSIIKRFSDILAKEQQKGFELLKKPL